MFLIVSETEITETTEDCMQTLTHHIGHCRVHVPWADHQTLTPIILLPHSRQQHSAPPQPGLVKLHHLALAVRHRDVQVALVVVVSQETACRQDTASAMNIPVIWQSGMLTFAWFYDNGSRVVPGSHERGGESEGWDV